MGERERAQHLVDHVESFAAGRVLVRLLHEGVHVELSGEPVAPAAAGHLHVQPLRHHDVLPAQEPGPVRGQLGLPGPLEKGEPHRKHREAGEHGQRAKADHREDRRDGAVERVAAHHVAQLVREQHPQLVVVQQLDRGRVDHDERFVDAVRAGVEERRLGDVELGDFGQSKVVVTSVWRCHSRGNWVGPIRTALPWNSSRTPRSPPRSASTFRITSSTPGTARSACSAARSAGCSQETAEISGKVRRGGEREGTSSWVARGWGCCTYGNS